MRSCRVRSSGGEGHAGVAGRSARPAAREARCQHAAVAVRPCRVRCARAVASPAKAGSRCRTRGGSEARHFSSSSVREGTTACRCPPVRNHGASAPGGCRREPVGQDRRQPGEDPHASAGSLRSNHVARAAAATPACAQGRAYGGEGRLSASAPSGPQPRCVGSGWLRQRRAGGCTRASAGWWPMWPSTRRLGGPWLRRASPRGGRGHRPGGGSPSRPAKHRR